MTERFLYQPFRFGRQGGVAVTDDPDRHLRDKVLAVLFTAPGERVNAPDFGVGLNRTTFEGIDDLLLNALRFRIVQGLSRDLGEDIVVDDVNLHAEPDRGEVHLRLEYRRRAARTARSLEIRL